MLFAVGLIGRSGMMGVMGGASIRWNPYIYAGANPVNFVDPSGEAFLPFLIAGLIGGGIGLFAGNELVVNQDVCFNRCGNNFADIEWDGVFTEGAKGAFVGASIGLGLAYPWVATAAFAWTTGYGAYSAFPDNDVLQIAGAFLGYSSVSYSIDVLRDPSASFGVKTRESLSALFHTALGISFVQTLGQATTNLYRLQFGSVSTSQQGLQRLASSEARAVGSRLGLNLPKPQVEILRLPSGFNGFRDGVRISISNTLGRIGRLSTFQHEMTHFYQIFTASRFTSPLVSSAQRLSVWATSGSRLLRVAKSPLYLFNPAELHAAVVGGNINFAFSASFAANFLTTNFQLYELIREAIGGE